MDVVVVVSSADDEDDEIGVLISNEFILDLVEEEKIGLLKLDLDLFNLLFGNGGIPYNLY